MKLKSSWSKDDVSFWEIGEYTILSDCCSLFFSLSPPPHPPTPCFCTFSTFFWLPFFSQLTASSCVVLVWLLYSVTFVSSLGIPIFSPLLFVFCFLLFTLFFILVQISLYGSNHTLCCHPITFSSLSPSPPLFSHPLGHTSAREMRTRTTRGKNGFRPVLTTSCTSSQFSGRSCLPVFLPRTTWMAGPASPSPSSSSACSQLSSVTWLLTLAVPSASRTQSLLWFLLPLAHRSQVRPELPPKQTDLKKHQKKTQTPSVFQRLIYCLMW